MTDGGWLERAILLATTLLTLALRDALSAYNRELVARGIPALWIGIGLNRGVGVAGLVGSRDLKEFAFFELRALPPTRVKGVASPLEIYALEKFAEDGKSIA